MYKVFINEVPVFFVEKNYDLTGFVSISFENQELQFFINQISKNLDAKIGVICENIEADWRTFLQNFEVRRAAGGLVKNNIGEFLWIYRFDKWDLPKGHIEKGESKEVSAIREVEEECGVTGLVIDKELETTYHVFQHRGVYVMKVTYWFAMHTTEESFQLVPQLEEGITKVEFKNLEDSKSCLSNTYGNIKLLFQEIV